VAERASCESERGRGALLYGTGRARGVPVGGVSYESESERGRALRRASLVQDGPGTRLRWAAFCCGLIVLSFIIVGYGYPHTVDTDDF
jgi:hypothetical protein